MTTRWTSKALVPVACGVLMVGLYVLYTVLFTAGHADLFLSHTAPQGEHYSSDNNNHRYYRAHAAGRLDIKYSNLDIVQESETNRLLHESTVVATVTEEATFSPSYVGLSNSMQTNISSSSSHAKLPRTMGKIADVDESFVKKTPESKRILGGGYAKFVPLYKISPNAEFTKALGKVADLNNTVILSVVDDALKSFALNFYYTSVMPFHLSHHLFVCVDFASQEFLAKHQIPCFYYGVPFSVTSLLMFKRSSNNNKQSSADFGSHSYFVKTNMKTLVVLDALQSDFNILMVDVDVVFFKDPFPYFVCSECDLHISMDREQRNSGFVLARSTRAAKQLYQQAWDYFSQNHKSHDQAYLNMARKKMVADGTIVIKELSPYEFPCGYYYFEADFRMFNNSPPCTECVMVHNNYIGSTAAKVYRFRENKLWLVDEDQYYSNKSEKFLTYNINLPGRASDKLIIETEMQTLKNAMILGTALNRAVILPTFSCCDCKTMSCYKGKFRCSLLSVLRLRTFDEEYRGRYREHVFMGNTQVPANVREAGKVTINIQVFPNNATTSFSSPELVLSTSGTNLVLNNNASSTDQKANNREMLLEWLAQFKDRTVIRFTSLPIDFKFVQSNIESFYYEQHEQESFECSDYGQWEDSVLKMF